LTSRWRGAFQSEVLAMVFPLVRALKIAASAHRQASAASFDFHKLHYLAAPVNSAATYAIQCQDEK
jgi:hypothetical protein